MHRHSHNDPLLVSSVVRPLITARTHRQRNTAMVFLEVEGEVVMRKYRVSLRDSNNPNSCFTHTFIMMWCSSAVCQNETTERLLLLRVTRGFSLLSSLREPEHRCFKAGGELEIKYKYM